MDYIVMKFRMTEIYYSISYLLFSQKEVLGVHMLLIKHE